MTLIELIVALVIVGIALAGLMGVLARTSRASADPLVMQQKVAIAESMMGEIQQMPFAPENGTAVTPNVRSTYNDILDYNGYTTGSNGIRNLDNTAVAGLGTYTVKVTVVPTLLTNIAIANDVLKITVTVTSSLDPDPVVLTGWRTNPEP